MTIRIGQPYTAGSWLVLAGSEEEFVVHDYMAAAAQERAQSS